MFEPLEDRLVMDGTTLGSLDVPGQRDSYTFSLPIDSRLYFDSQTNNGNLNWSLTGPAGTVVSGRLFTNSDANDISNPVLGLVAGDYTLFVDASGDATGPYAFELLDLANAELITPGVPVSGNLSVANETNLYRFDASTGDQLFFDVQSRSGATSARWRLVDPFSNVIFEHDFSGTSSDVDTLSIPRAGNYTLMIEGRFFDTGTGDYTFNVQPVANAASVPIAVGEIEDGRIDVTGETDQFTFTLPVDSRIYFDSLTNDGNLNWSLAGPSGTAVSGRPFPNSDAIDVSNPVLSLVSGDYTLTVDATRDSTGSYQFRLLDLASAVSITPGNSVSGELSPANESDLYRFDAAAGDKFNFDVTARSGAPSARWRLIDPYSNLIFERDFSGVDSDVNDLVLPRPGSYTLIIEGRVFETVVGTYTINVAPQGNQPPPPPPGGVPLVLDSTVNGTISTADEQDNYTFTLDAASRLIFDSLTDDGNFNWTLSGPAGTHVSGRSFQNSDSFDGFSLLNLPAGDYTLTVDGNGDATGNYSFRLLDLNTAIDFTPGTPVSGSFDPAKETDLYQFTVAAGQRFYFDQQPGTSNATWRLLDPYSNLVFVLGFTTDQETLTLTQSGTYTLVLEDRRNSTSPSSYTFNVQGVEDESFGYQVGSTASESIDESGEVDRFTFTLDAASRLIFDSFTDNGNFNWTLSGPAGTQVSGRSFQADSFDGFSLLNLPAGDYTLTVDGNAEATGNYSFRLLDLNTAIDITPGTPVSGSFDPAKETDLYQFTVAAGQRFYFDQQSANGNASWRLLDPYSNLMISQGITTDQETLTLTQSGTYTLVLEDRRNSTSPSSYTFKVQGVEDESFGYQIGTTASESIDESGEVDRFTFTLDVASRLIFDTFTDDGSFNWTLSGPAGTEVNGRSFQGSDSFDGFSLLNLPAGDYTLTVDGNAEATGNYSFRLLDLNTAIDCTPGTPVSGSFDPAKETDLYQFTVAAGQRFYFDQQSANGNASWRLLDPYSNLVISQGITTDQETLTLTQSGTYTLVLEDRRNSTSPSSYTFNVQPVEDESFSYQIGTTASESIDETGEVDRYTFTLDAASRLIFDTFTDSSIFNWTLSGPAGTQVSGRSFQSSDSFDGFSLLNLPAGDYTLTVDGFGDSTGPYSFRLLDLNSAIDFTPGAPVSGSFDPAKETDLYQFTVAAAGDKFSFDVQTGVGNASWRLVDPFSNVLFTLGFTTDQGTLALAQPGDYTLILEHRRNATGPEAYSFNVIPEGNAPVIPPSGTPIVVGDLVSNSIAVPDERDTYTFTLASDSRLYFDSLTNNSNLNWTLNGPAGTAVNSRTFTTSDSVDISNPVLNLVAGDYALTVAAAGSNTGAYEFRLMDLSSAAGLTPGTPVSGSLSPANETDLLQFDAASGDRLYFDVTERSGAGSARWRLVDPFSNIIFERDFGGTGSDVDAFDLPRSGTYTVLIEGRFFDAGSGSYTINVQPVVDAAPIPITVGNTINGAIAVIGEQDRFTFTLAFAANLYFDSFTNNSNFNWTLIGPAGTAVSHRLFTSSDANDISNPIIGLPAGDYMVMVDAAADATGPYQFRFLDLAAATVFLPGTPVSGSLDPANETDLYRFDGNEGDRVYFDMTARAGAPSARWRLVDSFSKVIFERDLGSDVDVFTLPRSGIYTLMIEGRFFDTGSGDYTFIVRPVIDDPPVPINSPSPVVLIDLQTPSDTGASSGDNLTNDTTPTFDVTVNQAGTISLDYDGDGVDDATQSVASAGKFVFTAPVLADGTRSVRATLAATAGGSVSQSVAVTVDTVGPRIQSGDSGVVPGPLDSLTVQFNESIDAATFATADAVITAPDNSNIPATSISGSGSDFVVHFTSQTALGSYTFQIGPIIADAAGNLMDQDNDSTTGEAGQDVFATIVTIAPQADLAVIAISAPTDLVIGNPAQLNVSWTVKNIGSVATSVNEWVDRVIFSRDAIAGNGDDVTVAEFTHSGSLESDSTYDDARAVTLPGNLVGDFFVYVRTDATGQVSEGGSETNNNSALAPIQVTKPFADLNVEAVSLPATALSGDPIVVSWRVRNNGVAASSTNSWSDHVVLSADDVLDDNDTPLGNVTHQGTLAKDATYTSTASLRLPDGIGGNFHVFVQADFGGVVFEFNLDDNNTGRSNIPIAVTEKPSPDLQPTTVNGPAEGQPGQAMSISFTVTNSGVGAASAPWNDRVYLSPDGSLNSAVFLATVQHTTDLPVGEQYSAVAEVVVPNVADGSYHFVIVTDDGDAVFEDNADDNNPLASAATISISRPDLVPTVISSPDSVTGGSPFSFQWEVSNVGSPGTELEFAL